MGGDGGCIRGAGGVAGTKGGGCSACHPLSVIVMYVFHLAYEVCCFPFMFLFSLPDTGLVSTS